MVERNQGDFSIARLLGLIGVLALVIYALIRDSSVASAFIVLPGLALVCGLTFFLLLAQYGRTFFPFCVSAVRILLGFAPSEEAAYAKICVSGRNYALASGIIAAAYALIGSLISLQDPTHVTFALTHFVVPLVYACVLSEIVFGHLYQRYVSISDIQPKEGQCRGRLSSPWIFLALLVGVVCYYFVMSFSSMDKKRVGLNKPMMRSLPAPMSTEHPALAKFEYDGNRQYAIVPFGSVLVNLDNEKNIGHLKLTISVKVKRGSATEVRRIFEGQRRAEFKNWLLVNMSDLKFGDGQSAKAIRWMGERILRGFNALISEYSEARLEAIVFEEVQVIGTGN